MKRLHKRFLLATFCALFTATLQAADVTITVNGRVVAKPCTIQTKEANVNLGDLYTRNLQQPGSASGWHNITLSLTDCPVETSAVTAIVTGSTDNTGYYKKQAICTGQARALICMGGNFALAMPDREASAVPLTQLDLAVHVATKLNRSHLLTARHSYILPVLGRSEIDMQKSGAQAVTVEDSMSMIHASRGVLKPAGVMLKSECAVVAGIAQATLPQSVVAWEYLVEDYDRIRNDIEAVLPEFADYNQRIRHPGGFHLINAAAERRWMTPSGKANFITSKGLLEDPSSAFNSKLVMATVRSHDQYNTTIYGMDDRYRGVFGQRDVVFMSAKQAKICRVKNGERVNLIALTPDGKRSSRRMDRLKVVIYPMADRSLVTYFPESNHMLTLDNHDPLSGIPGYKSIPVELEPSN